MPSINKHPDYDKLIEILEFFVDKASDDELGKLNDFDIDNDFAYEDEDLFNIIVKAKNLKPILKCSTFKELVDRNIFGEGGALTDLAVKFFENRNKPIAYLEQQPVKGDYFKYLHDKFIRRRNIEKKAKTACKVARAYNEYMRYPGVVNEMLDNAVKEYTRLSEIEKLSEEQKEQARKYVEQFMNYKNALPENKKYPLLDESIDINNLQSYTDDQLNEYYNKIYNDENMQSSVENSVQYLMENRFKLYENGGTVSSTNEKNEFLASVPKMFVENETRGYAVTPYQFITRQRILLTAINENGSKLFQEDNKFIDVENQAKSLSDELNVLDHTMDFLQKMNELQECTDKIPSQIVRMESLLGAGPVATLKEKALAIQAKKEDIYNLIAIIAPFKESEDIEILAEMGGKQLEGLVKLYKEIGLTIADYKREERNIKDTLINNSKINKALYFSSKSSLNPEQKKSLFEYKIEFKQNKNVQEEVTEQHVANALTNINVKKLYMEERKSSQKSSPLSMGRRNLVKQLQESINQFVKNPTSSRLQSLHDTISEIKGSIKSDTSALIKVVKNTETLIEDAHEKYHSNKEKTDDTQLDLNAVKELESKIVKLIETLPGELQGSDELSQHINFLDSKIQSIEKIDESEEDEDMYTTDTNELNELERAKNARTLEIQKLTEEVTPLKKILKKISALQQDLEDLKNLNENAEHGSSHSL